ncbi:Abi family protein [Neisseria dentiae]|uniref:Abi family protein n=1 Tax=Neisseria dentiae TaxID=194197 RepID=UPI00359F2516
MATFSKPAKNNTELIEEWKTRGLNIPDEQRAQRYLDFISYYRLSAYTIPFQDPQFQDSQSNQKHHFKPNISFNDILELYIFDRELRLLIMDAIERIEVAVRAQICNVHSLSQNSNDQTHGAFWYLDGQHFRKNFSHFRLLANIERQLSDEKERLDRDINNITKRKNLTREQQQKLIENSKKENFLRHYLSQYDEPRLPPCWMMMEMLTWGELSHLYAGLQSAAIQKKIADNLGVNAEILESWLKTLNSIRNICAHHGRLWNRELGVAIKIPNSRRIKWLSTTPQRSQLGNVQFERRVYSILTALQVLLYSVSPHSGWAKRLKALIDKYPNIPRVNMGMPENWHTDDFWKDALK